MEVAFRLTLVLSQIAYVWWKDLHYLECFGGDDSAQWGCIDNPRQVV
jgi:hypothetical protein